MANKFLIQDKTVLFKKKLDAIAKSLQEASASGKFQVKEELQSEAIRVVEEFYRDMSEPLLQDPEIQAEDNPFYETYNALWQAIYNDLSIIFAELENLEALTLLNFNFAMTEANKVLSRLKRTNSKLGDYILYSKSADKNTLYATDSFNDLSKVDVGSRFIAGNECTVNQDEGIVTLPLVLEQDSRVLVRNRPIINPNSNGVNGNNYQDVSDKHNDISHLLDGNPDTWFEYEQVVSSQEVVTKPLVLDITLALDQETIVNSIRINPNNFGTKTIIIIDQIDTSADGKQFISIKDDIPIGDFITRDEPNTFVLAPSSSKFAGQGFYTFTPRKVKYLRFVFRQTEPYVISTSQGDKLRYAIGIRDIEIHGLKFLSKGEVVSKAASFVSPVRKVLLKSNQNPIEVSELASITFQVSPDGGMSWYAIKPKNFEDVTSNDPDILSFNGPETNTIVTTAPVNSLILRATLERKDSVFVPGSSSLRKTISTTSEIISAPKSGNFELKLSKAPVARTVELLEPNFGSRGLPEAAYIIGRGKDKLEYKLPFELPISYDKATTQSGIYYLDLTPTEDWLHVLVGGEEWTHSTQPLSSYEADGSIDAEFRVFIYDPTNRTIKFGNGLDTMSPPFGTPIAVYFNEESLFLSNNVDNHTTELEFRTSTNQDDLVIKRYDKIETFNEILTIRSSRTPLKYGNIIDDNGIDNAMNDLGFTSKVSFLNGRDELTSTAAWSLDTENGVIYTKIPGGSAPFTYTHQPIFTLSNKDWEWTTDSNNKKSIIRVKESGWKTIPITGWEPIGYIVNTQLDLPHQNIVEGSVDLNFPGVISVNDDPFLEEVNFIDGLTEFNSTQSRITSELIPSLTPDGNDLASFDLNQKLATELVNFSGLVSFTDSTTFNLQVPSNPPTNTGEYYIDTSSNSITVKLANEVLDPGTIQYFYQDNTVVNKGRYSVDHKHGIIYTERSMSGLDFTASYQYTDLRASYRIARVIDASSHVIDEVQKKITLKDKELLASREVNKDTLGQDRIYQVNYDYVAETRDDVVSLKEYFTPVLKDYVLKVLTKDNIL